MQLWNIESFMEKQKCKIGYNIHKYQIIVLDNNSDL